MCFSWFLSRHVVEHMCNCDSYLIFYQVVCIWYVSFFIYRLYLRYYTLALLFFWVAQSQQDQTFIGLNFSTLNHCWLVIMGPSFGSSFLFLIAPGSCKSFGLRCPKKILPFGGSLRYQLIKHVGVPKMRFFKRWWARVHCQMTWYL